MWLSFFAGGYCAATALFNFLNKDYKWGSIIAILSILNIVLGVISL